MTDLERARHEAARQLQEFIRNDVIAATGIVAGVPLRLHNAEAEAVINSISVFVIKTIEHYLAELGDERRAGNGE